MCLLTLLAFCCPRGLRSSCSSPQLSSSASAARSATSRCESSVPVDELGVSAVLSSIGSGAATLVRRFALDRAGIFGGSITVSLSSSSDVAVSLVGDATMTGGGPRLVGAPGTQDGFAGSGGGRETPLTTEGGKHSRTVWKIWSGLINVHNAWNTAFGRNIIYVSGIFYQLHIYIYIYTMTTVESATNFYMFYFSQFKISNIIKLCILLFGE